MKRNYVPGGYESVVQVSCGTVASGTYQYFVIDGFFKFLMADISLFYGPSKISVSPIQYELVVDQKYTDIEQPYTNKQLFCQVKIMDSELDGETLWISGRNYGTFTDNEAVVEYVDTVVPEKIDEWWAIVGSDYYDKGEVDTLLSGKSNIIDIAENVIPVGDGANGLVDSGFFSDSVSIGKINNDEIIATQIMMVASERTESGFFGGIRLATGNSENTFYVRENDTVTPKQIIHLDGTEVNHSATIGNVHHVEAYGVHTAVKPVGSPFTKATRIFTIPSGWIFHIAFAELTASQLSVVFPNVSGDYIVYLNVATQTLSASTTFPAWGVGIPIARVWYSTVAGDEINMSWENHGIRTLNDHNDATAKHHTVGMLAEIQNRPLVIDGGQGTSVIGCTSGVLWDEDKKNTTSAKASDGTSAWTKFYFTGLTATGAYDLRRFPLDFGTATLAQITKIYVTDVDLGIGSTGRACFNNMSTGTPTMQAIASTSVMCIHLFQNDGILDTSALIIGQKEYTGSNVAQAVQNARAGVATEIASIRMGEGAARDSVHVGTVIINASGQKQWADDAQTTTVVQPNQTGVSSGGTVVDHNSLTGRSSADAHPTSAITGLDTALASKQPLSTNLTNFASLYNVDDVSTTISGITGVRDIAVFNGTKQAWLTNNIAKSGTDWSVRAATGYAGELDFVYSNATYTAVLYGYGTGSAGSALGTSKNIYFKRDGSIKDTAGYATKVASSDLAILANLGDVDNRLSTAGVTWSDWTSGTSIPMSEGVYEIVGYANSTTSSFTATFTYLMSASSWYKMIRNYSGSSTVTVTNSVTSGTGNTTTTWIPYNSGQIKMIVSIHSNGKTSIEIKQSRRGSGGSVAVDDINIEFDSAITGINLGTLPTADAIKLKVRKIM